MNEPPVQHSLQRHAFLRDSTTKNCCCSGGGSLWAGWWAGGCGTAEQLSIISDYSIKVGVSFLLYFMKFFGYGNGFPSRRLPGGGDPVFISHLRKTEKPEEVSCYKRSGGFSVRLTWLSQRMEQNRIRIHAEKPGEGL